jgi:hypothetical protein
MRETLQKRLDSESDHRKGMRHGTGTRMAAIEEDMEGT